MGRRSRATKIVKETSAKDPNLNGLTKDERELFENVNKLLRISTVPQEGSVAKAFENQRELSEVVDKIRKLEKQRDAKNCTSGTSGAICEKFLEWAEANGGKLNGCKIDTFKGYNLGLRVTTDIAKTSLVIAVPRKLMLSIEAASRSSLKSLLATDRILGNMPNVALAIFLLFEKFKENSFWKPYIEILPKSYNTVLYFTLEELEELKGSPTLEMALKQIKSIARQYAYFHKIFNCSDDAVCKIMRNKFTYNEYCWAVSTVMTRQNTIPSEDSSKMINALIPLWDICNHTNGTISTDYNPQLDRSECLALRDFKKDEQLFIFYGARTNADLFVHNGFVYEENEHDGYWIRLGVSKSDKLREKRNLLLDKLDIPSTGDFFIRKGSKPVDQKLLAFLRIFNMNSDQLDHWLQSEKPGDLEFNECGLDTVLEKKSWSFLQARLKLLLGIYKTTLEEDEGILKAGQLPENKMLAVKMRMTEKRILKNALEYVEEILKS